MRAAVERQEVALQAVRAASAPTARPSLMTGGAQASRASAGCAGTSSP